MMLDLGIKLALVLMVVAGAAFFWFSENKTPELEGELSSIPEMIPVNISGFVDMSGLGEEGYCPFINPYMSQLFSAGSIEVTGGNPLYGALCYVFSGKLGSDCGATISMTYDYDTDEYVLAPSNVEVEKHKRLTPASLSEKLNDYSAETGTSLHLDTKVKGWQCYLFFGVFPFIAMSLFLKDILGFSMLSPKLKLLISVFASVLAVITGSFAKFVWQLAYIASMSVQATFLVVMLFLMFISVILSWFGSYYAAVGQAKQEAAEAAAGLAQKYTFKAISEALSGKKQ